MNKGKYQIIKGDVTNPVGEGIKIIPHIISDLGVCGAGVAKAIVEKWPLVKKDISWERQRRDIQRGEVIVSSLLSEDIVVVSMIAQKGLRSKENLHPIRYLDLAKAMNEVLVFINDVKYDHVDIGDKDKISIHCPKFGSGLAGGDWKFIEKLIQEIWVDNGIDVTVYEKGKNVTIYESRGKKECLK